MSMMLKSLRVTAEIDASGYVQGAAQKVAADKAMIDSDQRLGSSLARADAQLAKMVPGLATLSKAFIPGYTEASKFQARLDSLARVADKTTDLDRVARIYEGIARSFNTTASAADLLAQQHVRLAPIVDQVNQRLATQAEIADRAARAMTAARAAQDFQGSINARLGVRSDFGTDSRAADIAAYGAELDRLAAKFDAGEAAAQAYRAEMAELNRALAVGAINNQQFAVAQADITNRFERTKAGLSGVRSGARLSSAEMSNLSYQFNDIAVMLASGQSPFMLLMQQGMQVGQIIGPMGLGGGVKALGAGILSFLLNPVNLAVVGFASLAGAASMFFRSSEDDLKTTITLWDRQTALLARAKDLYGDIAKIAPEGGRVLDFEIRLNDEAVRRSIQLRLEGLIEGIQPYRTVVDEFGQATQEMDLASPFIALRNPLEEALRQLRLGTLDAGALRGQLVSIADANPALSGVVSQIVSLLGPLDEAARKADALSSALWKSARQAEQSSMGALATWESEARANARRIGREADLETMSTLRGDDPATRVRIAVERERLAVLQEQIHPIEAAARIEAARRRAVAETTAEFAQQTAQIDQQNRQRMRAANDNLESARLDASLVGMSPAAAQEARANLQALMDLRRQAEDNAIGFDQAQYERLKAINAEMAVQARLQAERKLALDIGQERDNLYRTDGERAIRQRLNAAGIDEASDAWSRYAAELREIQEIESSFGYGIAQGLQDLEADVNNFAGTSRQLVSNVASGLEEAFVSFARTGKLTFTDLIDSMIADLARLAYQAAASGLLGMLGGSGGIGNALNFGLTGSSIAPSQWARGGAFGPGGVEQFASGASFSNSIVSRPTMFAYGGGRLGQMAEAGPEAVMPLRRGKDGKLGVAAEGGGVGQTIVMNLGNTIDARGAQIGFEQRIVAELDRRDAKLSRKLPSMIRRARTEAKI